VKVILFGVTGMVGQGVLRECLLDDDVEEVLVVGRTSVGRQHPKLREVVHTDFGDFSLLAQRFQGYDACYFCLGVSVVGMREAEYRRVTYDITMLAASGEQRPGPDTAT
jgi:nucleoside-diphosphate-sugar epimerase